LDIKVNGILRGLWLITECPHCHNPNVTNKVVTNGKVILPLEPKYYYCSHCEEGYFCQIEELVTSLDAIGERYE
jgi:transcription elongation factor Elf1